MPTVLLPATLACVVAFVAATVMARLDLAGVMRTALVADIEAYEVIGRAILDGDIPYTELPVEHLPLSLLPMIVLTAVSSALGLNLYPAWVLATGTAFVASAIIFDRIGSGRRFIALAAPLLPLVLFRVEPFTVLLCVAAIVTYANGRYRSGSLWVVLGSLAKGLAIALTAIPWSLGRQRTAIVTAAISAGAIVAVAATPGFRAAREFVGVHSETVLGGMVLVSRHLAGADAGIVGSAGAIYLDVGIWAVLTNTVPGLVILAVAFVILRLGPRGFTEAVSLSGLVVLGIMLTSPLLSTQFLFWLVPFLAFERRSLLVPFFIAAGAGLLVVSAFYPTEPWWAIAVSVKNIAVLVLAWRWGFGLLRVVRAGTSAAVSQALP